MWAASTSDSPGWIASAHGTALCRISSCMGILLIQSQPGLCRCSVLSSQCTFLQGSVLVSSTSLISWKVLKLSKPQGSPLLFAILLQSLFFVVWCPVQEAIASFFWRFGALLTCKACISYSILPGCSSTDPVLYPYDEAQLLQVTVMTPCFCFSTGKVRDVGAGEWPSDPSLTTWVQFPEPMYR